ncbi:MAG: glucose-1-phosphate thymidylyltransferase [Actinobacteria bacterium]|nr:glucose-1-phosphate thymidylyltransferase [Actinomycetota bacterium]MBM3697113.1 glucose-1-phosphate thymidylyltransferase [Actinomycetota bacterium]
MLSGGAGTRLRPITHTSAKQLVPVANKPVLFYGLEALRDAGITDIGIIIGDTGDEIREAIGDGSALGVRVTFIPQSAPLGLAHAVLTAEDFLGDSPFVMYLGDNLLRDGITPLVQEFRASDPDAMILLQHVPNPSSYGVAVLDGDRVVNLEEKPAQPRSDLALVGVYMFTPTILDAAKKIEPSARGELEITDAIQLLIDQGRRVEPHVVTGWWKDTGQVEDMLEANRLILDVIEPRVDGELIDSDVEGRVVIEAGARLVNSHVRGPAVIGQGAVVENAYIGPYSSISTGCVVRRAEIEHSILLERVHLEDLDARVESSLIGREVRITRSDAKPRAYRFVLGDSSVIGLT